MLRLLLLTFLLACLPIRAVAGIGPWETCQGRISEGQPVLRDCHPLMGAIDPQGRELWLRSVVTRASQRDMQAVYIGGAASSEIWFNGARLGANGQPGRSASTETPGRYQAAFVIPERRWRASDNALVVRMSSFHGRLRLDRPISGLAIAPYPPPSSGLLLAATFAAAGALFAAAFGFAVIHGLRRTGSSLTLAAMAGTAGVQAIVESLRTLVAYTYPFHAWRLIAIWGLTTGFAVLLTSYVSSRFWPRARRLLMAVALTLTAAGTLTPGFDLKIVSAMGAGVVVATVAAAAGVWRRAPGARLTLTYLVVFLTIGVIYPEWLADLNYFLLVAGLMLPLLMAEVVRLGRDDQARETALVQAAGRPDSLTVASARGVDRVRITDILAIVGADDYVELRLVGGRCLLHAARLDRLETDLPTHFVRSHRSAIVNLAHVSRLERDGDRGRLILDDGTILPVSRTRMVIVRDALDSASNPAALLP